MQPHQRPGRLLSTLALVIAVACPIHSLAGSNPESVAVLQARLQQYEAELQTNETVQKLTTTSDSQRAALRARAAELRQIITVLRVQMSAAPAQ